MPAAKKYDLLIKNVRIVRPGKSSVQKGDVAIADGKFARVGRDIPAADARKVVDGKGQLGFPGSRRSAHAYAASIRRWPRMRSPRAVLPPRAASPPASTTCAPVGYYLNKGGSYKKFFPEVLDISAGRFHVDYAYHLAPMDKRPHPRDPRPHREFRRDLLQDLHVLRWSRPARPVLEHQHEFLMIGEDEKYDIAHFEFVMRGIRKAMERYPGQGRRDRAEPALRDGRDHVGLHEDRARRRAQLKGCMPTARAVRRIPRGWRSSSPRTWPTRPICRTSTCCT